MLVYLARHMDVLEAFCEQEGLDLRIVLRQPKGVGEEFIHIYFHNPAKGKAGLLDETPMEILMTMTRDDVDVFRFEVTEFGRKVLAKSIWTEGVKTND